MSYFDNFYIKNIKLSGDCNSICEAINRSKILSNNNTRQLELVLNKISHIEDSINTLNESDINRINDSMIDKFFINKNNIKENYKVLVEFTKNNKSKVFTKSLIERCDDILEDIRIINNKNKLVNKIGFNESNIHNNMNIDTIIDLVYNICEYTHNYYNSMNNDKLFRIIFESIENIFENSNHIEDILESVVDYHIISDRCSIQEVKKELNKIKSKNKNKAIKKVKDITTIEKDKDDEVIIESIEVINDLKKLATEVIKAIKDKSEDNMNKTSAKVNSIIKKIYKIPKQNIIDGTPYILGFVRRVILVGGPMMIHPVLGIIPFIVDTYLENDVNLKETEALLKSLNKEKDKMEKIMDNSKNPARYKEHIDKIEKQISKIEEYKEDLTSDKEKEFREKENEDDNIDEMNIIIDNISSDMELLSEAKVIDITRLKENIRKNVEKLSAKDKLLSRQLDNSVNKMNYYMGRSLALDERDKVIQGKILPSASKCIKIAIALGVSWAINPAIAVVGFLGGLAASAKTNARERQLILDEIEIELKILDRKIQQAESDNEYDKLSSLLRMQNKLQREKQRIKYNMKVYYNQNTASSSVGNRRD